MKSLAMIYMALWLRPYWKAGRKQRGRECCRWRKLTGEENATNENNENIIDLKQKMFFINNFPKISQ